MKTPKKIKADKQGVYLFFNDDPVSYSWDSLELEITENGVEFVDLGKERVGIAKIMPLPERIEWKDK